MTRKKGKYPKSNNRQPFIKVFVARWDKDPNAMNIDITPVDLSDSCCPTCGCNRQANKG